MREIKFGDKKKDSEIEQYIGNKILGYEVMHGRPLRPARIKRAIHTSELMQIDSMFPSSWYFC